MAGLINLTYIKGIVPESLINSLESNFKEMEIDFESNDISGEPQAAAEELLAPIVLFLSSEVIQAYILGIATSTTYDIIKASIFNIWKRVSGKSLRKITPSGEKSISVNFDLDIRTPEGTRVKFKLKGNIPDNLQEKCIEEAFELIKLNSFPEIRTGYICQYNIKEDTWGIYEDVEFVKKFIRKEKG